MKRLIFVYNANSGLFNAIADTAHKTLSPETYQCNLCRLTYGLISEKKEWAEFIKSLNIKPQFLHKDELEKKFPKLAKTPLPAVFIINGSPKLLISSKELNSQKSLGELKELVTKKMKSP
ncbi:hypothetical protein IH980_02450 [Patescibacteria group bacterium]|nr:hypothetical protein [Patescibacteria group bacterium]